MTRTAEKQSAAATATTLAEIISHPTRRRCWTALQERTMSPKELADELGLEVEHVSYHVRRLFKLKVIELVREEKVRGAVAHWYRCIERPDIRQEGIEALTPEETTEHAAHVLQLEVADAAASLDGGILIERANHSLSRFPVTLDEEGWKEMADLFLETLERMYAIESDCVTRNAATPERRSISAVGHLNFFELPERSKRLTQF